VPRKSESLTGPDTSDARRGCVIETETRNDARKVPSLTRNTVAPCAGFSVRETNRTGICSESVTRLQQSPLDNATNVLQVHLR